jgi:thiol-disulfide isomerase/thioredoxin
MKKSAILFFATLTSVILFAQEAKLSGKLLNANSNMVYLSTSEMVDGKRKKITLDSSKIHDSGLFSLTVNVEKTTLCTFSVHNGEMTQLLLTPGDNMQLSLNTVLFDETIVYTGLGAEKNNAIKNISLYEEVIGSSAFAFPEHDTLKLFAYLDKAFELHEKVIADYVNEIPDFAEHGRYLIEHIEDSKDNIEMSIMMEIEFNATVAALKGTSALDFEGIDLEGNTKRISDYTGKITVIDFWATWCGPCKAEMPAYKVLEEKYGKEVNFLSVAMWCGKADWEKMANNYGFEHNIYVKKGGDETFRNKYAINFIPRYIVLDKDMKIIDAHAPRPSSGNLEKYF